MEGMKMKKSCVIAFPDGTQSKGFRFIVSAHISFLVFVFTVSWGVNQEYANSFLKRLLLTVKGLPSNVDIFGRCLGGKVLVKNSSLS
jgi:hypothetical protein